MWKVTSTTYKMYPMGIIVFAKNAYAAKKKVEKESDGNLVSTFLEASRIIQ